MYARSSSFRESFVNSHCYITREKNDLPLHLHLKSYNIPSWQVSFKNVLKE